MTDDEYYDIEQEADERVTYVPDRAVDVDLATTTPAVDAATELPVDDRSIRLPGRLGDTDRLPDRRPEDVGSSEQEAKG